MATFVLVPGMWLGGWAWREVADTLRAAGHIVFPVTLTGLGERVHIASPDVNLDTHVTDVVNLMHYEDLHDVTLVGHSYAGTVVNLAAHECPERVARLIYVDTWPLPEGVAQIDVNPPDARKALEESISSRGEGWRIPMPPWEELDGGNDLRGLGDAERARMRERAVDQPVGTIRQPVTLKNSSIDLPKTAIWCSLTVGEVNGLVEAYPEMCSTLAEPGWEVVEFPTGHWPMFSRPQELASLLAGLAR